MTQGDREPVQQPRVSAVPRPALSPAEGPARTTVFISYSRKDLAFVDRLAARLENEGIAPTIDRTEIYSFEDWWKRIQELIGAADTVIFVLSPDSVASGVCRREVDYALSLNKRFAPIVYRPVIDPGAVPKALTDLNFIFFEDPESFDPSMTKLVEALSTDIEWVREHTQLGLEAKAWDKSGRPRGLLLRSPRLEHAERWLGRRPDNAPMPTEDVRDFLIQSRSGATRRHRLLTLGVTVGAVLAFGAAVLVWYEQDHDRRTRTQVQFADAIQDISTGDRLFGQDVSFATGMYENAIRITKPLAAREPDNREVVRAYAIALQRLADAKLAAKQPSMALELGEQSVKILQGMGFTEQDGDEEKYNLVLSLDHVAYAALLNQQYKRALELCDQALKLKADYLFTLKYKADALMFLGQTKVARNTYLKYVGRRVDKRTMWEQSVLSDFSDFRESKLSSPLMNEIERDFKRKAYR